MKKLLFLSGFLLTFSFSSIEAKTALPASSDTSISIPCQRGKKNVSVKSYKKKNGTTVRSHKRSSPRR